MHSMPATALLAVALGLGASTSARAQITYDFEDLQPGRIAGQDGWIGGFRQGDGDGAIVARGTAGTRNETQVATGLGMNFEVVARRIGGTQATRPFNGNETDAYIQFDWRWDRPDDATGAGIGIGTDLDGDASIGFKTSPDRDMEGVGIRLQRGRFMILNDNFGPYGSRLMLDAGDTGDWYRMRLTMDFTADAGRGIGRLEYMNLTRGDTGFSLAASGTLDLDQLAPAAAVRFWDTITVTVGTNLEVDNLTVGVAR